MTISISTFPRQFLLLISILAIPTYLSAQTNLSQIYQNGVFHYLTPQYQDCKNLVTYISKPPNTPEYSITLDIKDNKFYLTYRKFKSNYWFAVFNNRTTNSGVIKAKTDSSSTEVSEAFTNQLIGYYNTKLLPDSIFSSNRPQIYDGTVYIFQDNSFSREIWETDFWNHKSYQRLIGEFDLIAKDLLNGSFSEKKYSSFFDENIIIK